MSVDDLRMRPGELACVCGSPEAGDDALNAHDLGRLAAGFGLSALAQALVLSTLPETSRLLAPTLDRLGWPYALLLVGAALATFPAAFLIDAFGRRSAFALGASLGVAGGLLTAFAASRGNFPALCLGAFWLGLAQGFALFYRHIAARGSALATRAGLSAFLFPVRIDKSIPKREIGGRFAVLEIDDRHLIGVFFRQIEPSPD